MLLEVIAALLIGIITLWFYNYCFYYSYLKAIPGLKSWPVIGCALELRNATEVQEIFLANMRKFQTNTIRIHLGFRTLVITKDYKFIEFLLTSQSTIEKGWGYKFIRAWLGTGLLVSAGEHWRSHRKIITPTFHFQILEQFIEVFHAKGTILIDKLRKQLGNPSFDVYPYITLYALDVICETAMGTSVNAQLAENSDYVQRVKDIGRVIQMRAFNPLMHSDYIYKFTQLYQQQQQCLKVLNDYTDSVIQIRRKELLKAAENKETSGKTDETGRKQKAPFLDTLLLATIDGKPLTNEEIRDEVSTFLFGGHDTTAAGVSSALYCLANNPRVQEKAMEELRHIFGEDTDRPCTYVDLLEMKYLDMVIKETLRLYPSVPFYTRQARHDFVYEGITYPKEMTIGILAYGIHRDPEYFPNPLEFQPERFSHENCDGRKPFCFIPFSAGQRNCIGQKFAFIEMKATLSRILRNFEVLPATPKHTLKVAAEMTLKATNGVRIALAARKH